MLESTIAVDRDIFSEVELEQAGTGLERIVVNSLRRVPPSDAPLLAWSLVCGSVVAERTRAKGFTENVLRVEVPDVGWKREMQNLAPRYLVALNRYCSTKVVRIEFVIQNESTDESKKSMGAK
jgi:hypothetical protein